MLPLSRAAKIRKPKQKTFMRRIDDTERPMPEINPEKVCFVAEKARSPLSGDEGIRPDASNPSDDDERVILTDAADRPNRRGLLSGKLLQPPVRGAAVRAIIRVPDVSAGGQICEMLLVGLGVGIDKRARDRRGAIGHGVREFDRAIAVRPAIDRLQHPWIGSAARAVVCVPDLPAGANSSDSRAQIDKVLLIVTREYVHERR